MAGPRKLDASNGAASRFRHGHLRSIQHNYGEFGVQGRSIRLSETLLKRIIFAQGAPAYTVTITPDSVYGNIVTFRGMGGLVNDSGLTQNIVTGTTTRNGAAGSLIFDDATAVGANIVLTNQGALTDGGHAGLIEFDNSSHAGSATYINEGGTVDGAAGGATWLLGASMADGAMFINNPGAVAGADGGQTLFDGEIYGNSTVICNAATVPGAGAGLVTIYYGDFSGAQLTAKGSAIAGAEAGQIFAGVGTGYATFTAEGGTADGAPGGYLGVGDYGDPFSAQTVVAALAGSNGGLGGTIAIDISDNQSLSQFEVFGNGLFDLSQAMQTVITIGSLAGDGTVALSADGTLGHTLVVGNNNMNTTFSGVIQGEGQLTKIGTGALTLNGASTYTGTTSVYTGTLGGSGDIPTRTNVGTGNGVGAALAPAAGSGVTATLTIKAALTFNADATYTCLFAGSGTQATSDQITAYGVTIKTGAQFNLVNQVQGTLTTGATFTVISNTASTPISGTFANLADGATITVNGTTFQASYEGGDGNDLTLTVE